MKISTILYLNFKNIFISIPLIYLIPVCILLLQIQIFSQEMGRLYLKNQKNLLGPNPLIQNIGECSKSIFPLRKTQIILSGNNKMRLKHTAKVSDYYQNSEVLKEKWDSTVQTKYLFRLRNSFCWNKISMKIIEWIKSTR